MHSPDGASHVAVALFCAWSVMSVCMYVSNTVRAEMLVSIDFVSQKYIRMGDLNGVGYVYKK